MSSIVPKTPERLRLPEILLFVRKYHSGDTTVPPHSADPSAPRHITDRDILSLRAHSANSQNASVGSGNIRIE